jgi:flagellar hook-basal body complex protein FliE
MTGISGIPGGAAGASNPLSGLAGAGGSLGGGAGMGGLDIGDGGGSGALNNPLAGGIAPTSQATDAQGASFGDSLRDMLIVHPSESKAKAGELAARFAAGDTSIDPQTLAIQSAKAGVEVQMATRTISSAVSAVRTLFQMQV